MPHRERFFGLLRIPERLKDALGQESGVGNSRSLQTRVNLSTGFTRGARLRWYRRSLGRLLDEISKKQE